MFGNLFFKISGIDHCFGLSFGHWGLGMVDHWEGPRSSQLPGFLFPPPPALPPASSSSSVPPEHPVAPSPGLAVSTVVCLSPGWEWGGVGQGGAGGGYRDSMLWFLLGSHPGHELAWGLGCEGTGRGGVWGWDTGASLSLRGPQVPSLAFPDNRNHLAWAGV